MPKPKAKGLEDVFKQDVAASGPMRNIEFFTQGALPIIWNTVEFNYAPVIEINLKPEVKASQINAVFKGVTYAKAEN